MKKVLVVVDMQNDFIDGALGTKEAEKIVPYAVEKIRTARENGEHIICTMDTHRNGYLQTSEGKNLPVEHCMIGTKGWRLHKDIVGALGDEFAEHMDRAVWEIENNPLLNNENNFILFRNENGGQRISVLAKGQFGSPDICEETAQCIGGYRLQKAYKKGNGTDAGIQIEMIGLCTDICVIANAILLKTYFPEADITVDSRGCAGVTEEKHNAALEVMRSCQINVI